MSDEINEILNSLKKRCSNIIFKQEYEYWEKTDDKILSTSNYLNDENWIVDSEGRDLMFQVINFEGLHLANEIKKLQYFYNSDSSNVEISHDAVEYVAAENISNINGVLFFEESYNLPDWETLKIMHEEEYEKLIVLFKKDAISEDDFYDIYEEYSEKLLGHKAFNSFVGGNLNQVYWLYLNKEFYRQYEFIMQIQTNFYTFVHIFRNKENKKDFKSFMGRS